MQGTDGYFYGATAGGGLYNNGIVFKMTASGTLTVLYSFTGGADGSGPSGLVQATNGDFYGTTARGGNGPDSGDGTIFKITSQGQFTTLYTFTGGADGFAPGPLVEASDGNLYGTTSGDPGNFTIFRITPDGTFTTVYTFYGSGGSGGGKLIQAYDGNLYGTGTYSGTNNDGMIYKNDSHWRGNYRV